MTFKKGDLVRLKADPARGLAIVRSTVAPRFARGVEMLALVWLNDDPGARTASPSHLFEIVARVQTP